MKTALTLNYTFFRASIYVIIVETFMKQPRGVFYKKIVLKSFAIFIGKHLCWSLFLIKLMTFSPATQVL